MKKLFAAALLLAAGTLTAHAADAPRVVGNWTSNGDMAAARMGKGPFFDPSKLTLYNGEKVISYRIEVQDGRAFAGVIGTGDKEAPVTGVFQMDGKNFIFSDSFGSGFGTVDGTRIELCWADSLPDYVSAASVCAFTRRPATPDSPGSDNLRRRLSPLPAANAKPPAGFGGGFWESG
ncbi:hypothetical protein [Xanthobacter sp. YC-JY1]|uniref:hypothetical protein n=1 Tax=Xanthobacter sp. YC-JY1 TaxID=2419844 RepID=UPI001F19BB19|nr:hypothetical protein [Xanthobacter sp. YC-JY1]UJX47450.1 hypothetical protein D7006_23990 [Xanthobacter sp. YC-JY1]